MTPENTPPVLYALWSDEHGYFLLGKDTPMARPTTELLETEWPSRAGYRIVTLTPSLEVRGE